MKPVFTWKFFILIFYQKIKEETKLEERGSVKIVEMS